MKILGENHDLQLITVNHDLFVGLAYFQTKRHAGHMRGSGAQLMSTNMGVATRNRKFVLSRIVCILCVYIYIYTYHRGERELNRYND